MKYKIRFDLKLDLGFVTLYRIEKINTKELGGYIENEKNLSQFGNCWVSGDAKVYGNAKVSGNAELFAKAFIQRKDDMTRKECYSDSLGECDYCWESRNGGIKNVEESISAIENRLEELEEIVCRLNRELGIK